MMVGCSFDHAGNAYLPYPVAQNSPLEYQDKLQAAAHWDLLAANEAEEISVVVGKNSSISFEDGLAETDFNLAYKKMLTGHLLGQGVRVLGSAGDYLLKYETQILHHSNRDALSLPAGMVTSGTIAGLLAVNAASNWTHSAIFAIPIVYAEDWFSANSKEGKTPDTEVLITTELHQSNEVVESSTRIYYFNQGNESMYETPPPVPDPNPHKLFQVTDQI
jgi:hypothetical protein|tara:strand:+ start:297 stop:953 length:657 start_codon:yes stop_codon:yes gene_type:complete